MIGLAARLGGPRRSEGGYLAAARCDGKIRSSTRVRNARARAGGGSGRRYHALPENALGDGALIGGRFPGGPRVRPRAPDLSAGGFWPWLAPAPPPDPAKAVHGRLLARCRVLFCMLGAARR
jgi:hypothetical protein